MQYLVFGMLVVSVAFGASDQVVPLPNLAFTWLGWSCLVIFVVGYYFIATEENYKIDKAKPALFLGTLLFILIGAYYAIYDLDQDLLHAQMQHLILEIAEIVFFLFVAMTYIETLIKHHVFEVLKYKLVARGYTYKKLFWVTGVLAFFLSPIADNLTTALILSTVLLTIDRTNKPFLVLGAINIVVASNAGGSWSPFGDITTLMAWSAGKGSFADFLFLLPSALVGYGVTALLLAYFVPQGSPRIVDGAKPPQMDKGAKRTMTLGVITIALAVFCHQVLHIPAMWGMMFGLSLLMLLAYRMQMRHGSPHRIFDAVAKIEFNTLLFFFGILAAVGALYVVGWLNLVAQVYDPSLLGPTWSNVGVGFLSALVDNVPVMSAVLKANPQMSLDQWMLVTLSAGIGGSLISFGSAAGVGVMGKLYGVYTFMAHLRYAWAVLVGYAVSIGVWFLQYQILKIGV